MTLIIFNDVSTGADAVSGERIFPGDSVVDTRFSNQITPYMRDTLTRFVKESTIVWLAEQAGYDVIKRDAGNSVNAEGVDGTNVSVGDGAASLGEVKVGRRKSVK